MEPHQGWLQKHQKKIKALPRGHTVVAAMAGYTALIPVQEEAAEREKIVLHNDKNKKVIWILHDIGIKKMHFWK